MEYRYADQVNTESFVSYGWLHNEAAFLVFEASVMFVNVAMFNVVHPGHILPGDARVYIDSRGEERTSDAAAGALHDARPLVMKIVDPLDIGGLFKKKDSQQKTVGTPPFEDAAVMLDGRQT